MSFHPTGKVLSCSRKPSTVIGDIRTQRLDDIWNSPVRRALRESLLRYDFPAACAVCAHYIACGDYATADAVRTYGTQFVRDQDPQWPARLEFNLSNTCGLQCVMCSGDYSSTIRALREKRPPLPRVYGDEFFLDLRKYLAHVRNCIYLGGEPFSQTECYRIWEMLLEDGRTDTVNHVTTNGMVWSPRVERIVDGLRMVIAISFDGATAATVEAARVGASFATMLKNAGEFGRRVGKNHGDLVFNFCPMRSNWREFPDFLLLAEAHGARAYVNTMVGPEDLSLYFLPRAELQAVVDWLSERSEALGTRLQRTRPAMENLLQMLRNKLAVVDRERLRLALAGTEAIWRDGMVHIENPQVRRAADVVERGRRVLASPSYPGSIPVHHARGIYPFYAESVAGARMRDAAGREYLDWYISGGAVALGHQHPAVVEAVRRQLDVGMNLTQPAVIEVDVAEQLCRMIPSAEQVVFGKNGTDVVGAAVRAARMATGRERVLVCGYHGFQDWSLATEANSVGIPAAYRELALPYRFNDLGSAVHLLERHRGQVAAIVLEPIRQELPTPEFLHGLRELADRHGAALVFDEIVTCFRTARGGVQATYGVRPDLTCVAKAIANGLPLSAVVGKRRWMRHLEDSRFGMTYRWDGLAFAAAQATLSTFEREDVSGRLRQVGEMVQQGFAGAAQRHGLDWSLVGDPTMPWLRLQGGGRLRLRGATDLFVQVCARLGVVVRMPRLLPSLAHTPEDVAVTLEVFDQAMRTVRTAMERGLDDCFDGPIWDAIQAPAPKQPTPARTLFRRTDSLPAQFAGLPPGLRDAGVTTSVVAADDSTRVVAAADGAGVVLEAGRWEPDANAFCALQLVAPVQPVGTIEARYTIEHLPRTAGHISIQLVLRRGDSEWALRHNVMFGARAMSELAGNGTTRGQIAPYGLGGAVFRFEFDRGNVRGLHCHEWDDDLGTVPMPEGGPLQLSFRLSCAQSGREARVRLVDLGVR
ncbi:MAG: aminotransferase class III-fold pyridoxal phosphate-dependent enzyme [Planctomycetes bacterium]|nr:aminotransferase class III-fold pyridoxal phosphate-dependent enzyme [Planctomycetota bacterium]